jgi:photosystem II stability/assembly factor-like uncharacterized protein
MKRTMFIVLLMGVVLSSQGQNVGALQSDGKTFTEICTIMEQKFQGLTFIKGKPNFSREFMQFKRWEFFWKRNLLPNGDFSTSNEVQQMFLQDMDDNGQRAVTASNWKYFGPKVLPDASVAFYPGFGRVNAIAIHPTNHNTLIAGAAGSGIWKSTDKGVSWSAKMDGIPNVGISDIVYDPNNLNIIYAISGDADGGRNPYSTGMLKSVDAGETWAIIGLNHVFSDKYSLRRMIILGSPANTIIATANDGIHKTTDGGQSWASVSSEKGYCIVKINDQTFLSGTSDGKILKSTNAGNTWINITPSNVSLSGRVELGVTPNDANFVFALDASGTMTKSTNGGTSWTSLAGIPSYDSQGGYNITVAVSPNDKDKIIVGGIMGWRSTNGGSTWEQYLDGYWVSGNPYFYVHSDHHMMRFVPGGSDTLYNANDGGVFYGDFTQNTPFVDATGNMYITQYYGLGGLRTDDKVIIAGAQDNDGVYINGNTVKGLLAGSDGYDGMIDYSNPNVAYITTTGAGNIEKTTDGWQTTSNITIGGGFSANWDVVMAMHPTNPSTIFFGGNKLMRSTDKGINWTALFDANGGSVTSMAIAPSTPATMYLATESGSIKKTVDNGQNWTTLTSLSISSSTQITGLAVNATNSKILYATVSGFEVGKKVFKSINGGVTWLNISYNLPNVAVNHVVYAAGTNDDVYIATDLGVYLNSNNQNTWEEFKTKLPYTRVMELEINYASNSIFAATFGRGIWKSPLENNSNPNGINEQRLSTLTKVFPTLNTGIFTVSVDSEMGANVFEVVVFNSVGGVVVQKTLNGSENVIDISSYANGSYFVNIKSGSDYITYQIILQHD